MDRTNCVNCGAPLKKDGTCEYCGTKVNRNAVKSVFSMTSDCIRFETVRLYAEDKCVGEYEVKE